VIRKLSRQPSATDSIARLPFFYVAIYFISVTEKPCEKIQKVLGAARDEQLVSGVVLIREIFNMKSQTLTKDARLAPMTLVFSALLIGGMASADAGLATADQQLVEARALNVVALPEVKEQIEASERVFAELPIAADPEAKRALRPAVEELAFATALDAANSDTNHPKVVWAFTAPRTWLGRNVPGSRWGIDNPDNVYRLIPDRKCKAAYDFPMVHTPGIVVPPVSHPAFPRPAREAEAVRRLPRSARG
jgi:hypothetical protein